MTRHEVGVIDYRKHIETAIQATVFHSPTTFSWFGKRSPDLPIAIRQTLTPKVARSHLLFNLQSRLYSNLYCQGAAVPTEPEAPDFSSGRASLFVEALSEANSGKGYWDSGWEVRSMNDEEVVVCKGGIELQAQLGDRLLADKHPPTIGTHVRLRFSKEFVRLSPGFYIALSDDQAVEQETQPLVRIYWNLTAEVAIQFVQSATLLLNKSGLPFRLKVPSDPTHYKRCDAGVIYVRKSDYANAADIFERLYFVAIDGLRNGIPVFTKQLARGVSVAEDPGSAESFGQHRCRLLGDGLIRAYERGASSIEERLQLVEARFMEAGISLETPFLNPGSHDMYVFQPQLDRATSIRTCPAAHANSNTEAYLSTADNIGKRLSRDAMWYADCCNWLGAAPNIRARSEGQAGIIYRALGPDLYNGTSGVALFLAELYATTGDAAARRLALGAIRQALGHVEAVSPIERLGFYTGWIGIAFAAARTSRLLGEEALLTAARQLLQRAVETQQQHEFDLLSGSAGAIVGVLALRELLPEVPLLEFAARLGDELVQTADASGAGCSWRSLRFPKQRNLTGFSHGVAGIGFALLELFQATGDSDYLRTAVRAFQYERSWFDIGASNWPDFRGEQARSKHITRAPAFAVYWCHGAPGIGLSRLYAYQVLKDNSYKSEAIAALQTTRHTLENALQSKFENFSLCHGLTGNAEVLRQGCQVLGQEWVAGVELASRVANAGLAQFAAQPDHLWPCGAGGETPGLMLGLAGIGLFYLRMHNPSIPSILMPQPEAATFPTLA